MLQMLLINFIHLERDIELQLRQARYQGYHEIPLTIAIAKATNITEIDDWSSLWSEAICETHHSRSMVNQFASVR